MTTTFAAELREARTMADMALAAMARHKIPPSPRNYAVWFAHFGGRQPELSRAIEEATDTKQPFTSDFLDELFVKYIAREAQSHLVQQSARRLQGTVQHLLQQLGEASGSTRAYSERLDAFSAELGEETGLDKIRNVLTGLADETQRVIEQNQSLELQLVRSSGEISELRRNLAIVQHEAMTDGLTGIPNRKYFDAQLRASAKEATLSGESLCVMLIDIDRFKSFNDSWGHQLGDQVLRLVAKTLTDCVKGRDVTARFGGEEFAILLERTELEGALMVAEQIRIAMMRRKVVRKGSGDDLGSITVSIGIGLYRADEDVEELLSRADAALYSAKRAGRNKVVSERDIAAVAPAA
jgi:diguanylate cyclase